MTTADRVSVSIPEMDTLTDAQNDAVTKLLSTVSTHYGGKYPPQFMRCRTEEDMRILAYKYLKARGWNADNAMEMITTTMTFREEKNADTMDLFPCVFPLRGYDEEDLCRTLELSYTGKPEEAELCYRAIAPYYSAGYHYWDKEGHPVLYDFSGRARVKELMSSASLVTPVGKQAKDTITAYHLYMNLVQERLVQYADVLNVAKGGRRILGTTVVFDAEGLHLGMISSQILDVVRAILQMDQKYFPEVLHRLFVVNCPGIVMHVYGLVKGSLDKNTQQKLSFCSKSQSLEVLKKVIDEDKIPSILGGSCKCSGGCIPGVDGECQDIREVGKIVPLTQNISVGAGKKHTVELEVQPEDEVHWEFRCTKGNGGHAADIHFDVTFTAHDSAEESMESSMELSKKTLKTTKGAHPCAASSKPVKSGKLDTDCDRFCTTERGVVKLVWDNYHSWIHGKHLQLRINQSNCSAACSVEK
ncbi:hypothetical protein DQ04_08171030 [Trypanosoma grayi]|uniref:hypothetical protein n=1 Tax=Trypanosoma grayi TaxID=71804 RepID=UPI0004F48CC0|nr:hypothetical protein DQ04_08171030 [Trypanosoma grayi]KEG08036.1 hypothetical protein DQ04_08171030 [Trypanosoma grayi]